MEPDASGKKKIAVLVSHDGKELTIDLGGSLDNGCCGCAASRFNHLLAKRGIKVTTTSVACRLPIMERIKAKLAGVCHESPLDSDPSVERRLVR